MNLSPSEIGIAAVVVLVAVGSYGLMILRNVSKLISALILTGKTSGQLMLAQRLAAAFILIDTLVAVIGYSGGRGAIRWTADAGSQNSGGGDSPRIR